jgi:UDP:flavonoid glycosyltransferase YjiC (YdhE family)
VRVLCTCNPLLGHLHPLLPLATALRTRGHDVAFLTGDGLAGPVAAAGFPLVAAGTDFDSVVAEALVRAPDTPLVTPEDQQRFGFGQLFSAVRTELLADEATAAASAFAPDLVVNDVADFVGALVAARLGVPNATAGIGLVVRSELIDLAAEGVAAAWTAAGLAPRPDAGLYRSVYLNQLPRSVQSASVAELPVVVQDLRPVPVGEGDAALELGDLGRDRPLVYVTFGTVFGDVELLRAVVAEVATLDVDVLVTVGPSVDPDAVAAPHDRIVVRDFVPQGAVLDRCRLVVSHGGVGSVVGPLRYGVPLLLVPRGADQEENAARVAATGAGRIVEPGRPGVLAEAATALLTEGVASARARAIAEEIAAMPAPAEVAASLERVAAAGVP